MKKTDAELILMEIKDLIYNANRWVSGDTERANRIYKYMEKQDATFYSLGWKMGVSSIIEKLQEIETAFVKRLK